MLRAHPQQGDFARRRQFELVVATRGGFLFLDLPAVFLLRQFGVQAPEQERGDQARHRAAHVRLPRHAGLARQHGQHHAAVEQERDHAGGDRGAVATQQAQHEDHEHQPVGQAAGTQRMRAGIGQQPRPQPGPQPHQRDRPQRGPRIDRAGQRAEDQQCRRVGGDVLQRAVQQRCGEDAEQAVHRQRRDGEGPHVEAALRRIHHRQQQHEGQAQVEGAEQAAAVVALLGFRIEGRIVGMQVHGPVLATGQTNARPAHPGQTIPRTGWSAGIAVRPPCRPSAAAPGSAPRSRPGSSPPCPATTAPGSCTRPPAASCCR